MTATERAAERLVAGLWCHEVLDLLPDLVDDALSPDQRASVDAHLAGCDWCEHFGGAYVGVVGALRDGDDIGAAPDVTGRLLERLDED